MVFSPFAVDAIPGCGNSGKQRSSSDVVSDEIAYRWLFSGENPPPINSNYNQVLIFVTCDRPIISQEKWRDTDDLEDLPHHHHNAR